MQTEIIRKRRSQYSSDRVDFKTKAIKKDKNRYHIMIKGKYKESILHSSTYMHPIW